MTDISQIQINNELFNIKDSEARSDIISLSNNYLPLSGGTLTNHLMIKNSNADSSTTISSETYKSLAFQDKNERNMGLIQSRENSDGSIELNILARRYNNANVENRLQLKVAADGTKSITVSDSGAWRIALGSNNNGIWPISLGGTGASTSINALINLGALPLSGGTLTGILQVKASQYADDAVACGIDMNNSNIIKLNAIYTADAANNASEGIHFYRDATHYDSLWIASGAINFVPNRELGTNTTAANSQKVARFTATPTTEKIVKTDGTTGGILASSLTADDIPNLNASKITAGTLSTSRGGTGATDAINARKNLGYLGMFFAESVNSAECTSIPANANLNSPTYCVTGKYVCGTTATVGTLTNCPASQAFQMLVFNLLSSNTGAMPDGQWMSRTRILMDYQANIYVSNATRQSSGSYGYSAWKKITTAAV